MEMCENILDLHGGLTVNEVQVVSISAGPRRIRCRLPRGHSGSHLGGGVPEGSCHLNVWDDGTVYHFDAPEGFGFASVSPRGRS